MGQVYRATDTTLGRQVAIKILPDAFAADPDRLARFEREAKTLASLNHPNIAAIYGFEKPGGAYALVMELVDGEDLSQRTHAGWLRRSPLVNAGPFRSMKRYRSRSRSPTRWKRRTSKGSSTAISSLRTSSCEVTARSRCSTSAWRRRWSPPLGHRRTCRSLPHSQSTPRRRGSSSARPPTWRPNRRRANPSTNAPTSGRSASSCTRCLAALHGRHDSRDARARDDARGRPRHVAEHHTTPGA